jgi:GNAT superfamily N-acetyltransferase
MRMLDLRIPTASRLLCRVEDPTYFPVAQRSGNTARRSAVESLDVGALVSIMTRLPTPALAIRPAEPADAAALTVLYSELGYPASPKDIEERLRAVLRNGDHALFVADDGAGAIAGCVHGSVLPILENDLTLQIFAMVVSEKHRREGIGRRLVAAVEDWGRSRGCAVSYLRCNIKREPAHAFWAAVGYENRKTQFAFRKKL